MNDIYVNLYKPTIVIDLGEEKINLNNSELVSISFMHNYDTASYPIIRLRIYADISRIYKICDNADSIRVNGVLGGGIYKLTGEDKTPVMVHSTKDINLHLKGYIETKNIPYTLIDEYKNGLKNSNSLNENRKVPLEIYCYDESLIHKMKQQAPSIYKNITVGSAIEDTLQRNGIYNYSIDPIMNQTRNNQILIPNLNITQAISFIDRQYGLYPKGASLYGDIDKLYISNLDTEYTKSRILPIYVESSSNNTDMSGLIKINNEYKFIVTAANVSIQTETDIERVLHSIDMSSVNLMDLDDVSIMKMENLFKDMSKYSQLESINIPSLLHKTKNKYLISDYISRIDEKITKIDVSGAGFDITQIKPDTRMNLVFKTPIRGLNINKHYRPQFANHVLSNMDSKLFIAQTTMTLCTN